MKLKSEQIKRCGIFLFFDKDGVVDKYVINLLNDLKKNLEYLLVVCNGYVDRKGLRELHKVSDEILCRANVGFDVGGYREGLFYLGWKKLQQYDEVVLANYTFFGPLFPFSEMFDSMAERELDFWGITKHHKVVPDPFGVIPYGFLPEHIQSHFLVLRKSLFTSYQYRDFIYNMRNPDSYLTSICTYEAIFTKHFEDLGFAWDVYVNTDEYEGYSYNPLMFYTKELIETKRCPIIKRRSFFTNYEDYLLNTCGETSAEMYQYLKKNMLYDLNMIWDNLLRLENMTAIHRVLHLNNIFESYDTEFQWNQKFAIVILVESIKRKQWYEKYLKAFPDNADIFICGEKEAIEIIAMTLPEKCHVECYETTDDNILWRLKKVVREINEKLYNYIGIARIRDIEQFQPYSNDVSWQYADWENMFGNYNIIGNILNAFENNSRMGMCIPPIPCYGTLFVRMDNGWCGKFQEVYRYLQEQGVSLNISEDEAPLSPIGGSFWIRSALLKNLADISDTSDEVFLLALPFFVQKLGGYTGIGYSDFYAPIEITNQDFKMRENNKVVFKKYGANYHKVVVERIRCHDFSNGEEKNEIS